MRTEFTVEGVYEAARAFALEKVRAGRARPTHPTPGFQPSPHQPCGPPLCPLTLCPQGDHGSQPVPGAQLKSLCAENLPGSVGEFTAYRILYYIFTKNSGGEVQDAWPWAP